MTALTVARELARRRREAGLSQAEVAARMGTSQGAVSRVESGRVTPTLEFVDRFARAIGTPVTVVFGLPDVAPTSEERRRRVERALGKNPFDPWGRDPTPAEQRSLLADGLTRERFKS
jgi:transcriptional regulator with XRE-family HTH domain